MDIKDFLSELDKTSETTISVIHVPSINKDIEFELFNVRQQKLLLKTAFEGVEGVINSNIFYNNFIHDNCKEPVEFSIIDRPSIIVNLRKSSLNDTVTIKDTVYDLNELGDIDYSKFNLDHTVISDNITCNLHIPTLVNDTSICKRLVVELTSQSDEQKKTESVSLLLTYEIMKYIKSMQIADTVLEFNNLSIYERKTVIEKLPLKLNNLILDFIVDVKAKCTEYLTFEDGAVLEIDASFLSSE